MFKVDLDKINLQTIASLLDGLGGLNDSFIVFPEVNDPSTIFTVQVLEDEILLVTLYNKTTTVLKFAIGSTILFENNSVTITSPHGNEENKFKFIY